MKHLLFIIGDEIIINENYKEYIYRKYEEKFKEIQEIKILNKTDKELPFILEELIKEYDFITIFSANEHYPIIAKIIATLNDDNLVLKEDTLVANKALSFSKNSFFTKINDKSINLLKISSEEKLPKLLGEVKLDFEYFCIFDMDKESVVLLLQTITKSYEINIKANSLLSNLTIIKASSLQYGQLTSFIQGVQKIFGAKFFLGDDPIKFISEQLIKQNLKISFAESCTGGLCASEITKIEGISQIFEGSIISYSNRIKNEWLGISESVLEDNGEYSERCIYFMLKGIFKTAKPDFAIAISGVVGKDDIKNIKSGTIFIGVMYKDGTYLQERLSLQGDREYMRKQAVMASFCLLMKLKPQFFNIG